MHSDDPFHGLPLMTTDLGRVQWQGTTVNPADLSLAQPSQGPIQSYGVPLNVAPTGYSFVGYHPIHTSHGAPVMFAAGHSTGQFSMVGNPSTLGHPPDPSPFGGRVSRGLSTCQWKSGDGSICGQPVTGRTVPSHLAKHGVRSMNRDLIVQCGWNDCQSQVKRQSITRHCREVHLGLKRKSHGHAFPWDLL